MCPASLSKNLLNTAFQPFQIVGLEDEATCLYAEVVQVVAATQVCWVRPLILVHRPTLQFEGAMGDDPTIYDLRQGSDLLLPIQLFREALDSEVIPLLSRLQNLNEDDCVHPNHHSTLNQFVKQVCLRHPEVFSGKTTEEMAD